MLRPACLLAALLVLAGCGGMNRAVAVLPNTLDDLAARSRGDTPSGGDTPSRVEARGATEPPAAPRP